MILVWNPNESSGSRLGSEQKMAARFRAEPSRHLGWL